MRPHAPRASACGGFDRFSAYGGQRLNRAVDEVRRSEMRRLSVEGRATFKKTRFLLLKNPWNLTSDQQNRLSTLVLWNTPIVRAWYLKESFQLFWNFRQPARAADHLKHWIHSAMRS